jgi:hypothetical protein
VLGDIVPMNGCNHWKVESFTEFDRIETVIKKMCVDQIGVLEPYFIEPFTARADTETEHQFFYQGEVAIVFE